MDWRCVEANSRKRHWTVVLKQIPGSRCWSKNLNGAQVYAHTLVVSFIRWHELSAGRQGDRYELPRGRMTRHPFWNAVWLIDVAMSRGFIFFIDSLLALCAAATRDWGKLFPCVHHICYYTDSCSEARHDARERLLCRSLHALDCQRRLAPMQYPLTTGVLQGIPSAGSLSAGHASARCLIRYRMFGTRRCPR
jgi:hypothetical protein